MTINEKYTNLLKYKIFKRLVEIYCRRKLNCSCFIMYQNKKWTIVTIKNAAKWQ